MCRTVAGWYVMMATTGFEKLYPFQWGATEGFRQNRDNIDLGQRKIPGVKRDGMLQWGRRVGSGRSVARCVLGDHISSPMRVAKMFTL